MTAARLPDDDGEPRHVGRFEWERSIRRLRLGHSTKGVALMLATYSDKSGTNAHPGVERLAADLEVDERTVRRHLTRLVDLKLLTKTFEGSSAGRRRLADCYALMLPHDVMAIGLTDDPATRTPDGDARW